MTTAVKAVYENGVFKPEEPVALADKAKVRLIIEESAPEVVEADQDPTGWRTARELIGCIRGAPPDVSENHDKYLYGQE